MKEPILVEGDSFSDGRGRINFFNSFNMQSVIRMYEIQPFDTDVIRAWQGHEKEKKWFYCNAGSFIINLISIDNFENPSNELKAKKVVLSEKEPNVLEVPGGYASGIKATEPDSKLLVFSDFTIEESKRDDFRFDVNFWKANWK